MIRFAEMDASSGGQYAQLLRVVAQLSGLFSQSEVPYINYRAVENIFCREFGASNLSRSDMAFDAVLGKLGIGIKTFVIRGRGGVEKVAEFNQMAPQLAQYSGKDLAVCLAGYRNERIALAERTYGVTTSQYHIVGRSKGQLIFFEDEYDRIDIDNIQAVKANQSGISFSDGKNDYKFYHAKSTLFKRFEVPKNATIIDVEILSDPFDTLRRLDAEQRQLVQGGRCGEEGDFVILPLYSIGGGVRHVPVKSGLNQWNAGGRERSPGEIYIPIPTRIHQLYPKFFPERNIDFKLSLPTGEVLKAKVCQDNSKALMTNPNSDLSKWLLRTVLKLKEGKLATIEKLDQLGFDSVRIHKTGKLSYKIDISKTGSFESFLGQGDQ